MNYTLEFQIRQAIRTEDGRSLAEAVIGNSFLTFEELEAVFDDEPGGWM